MCSLSLGTKIDLENQISGCCLMCNPLVNTHYLYKVLKFIRNIYYVLVFLLVDVDHWRFQLVDVDQTELFTWSTSTRLSFSTGRHRHPDVSGQRWTSTVDAVDVVGVHFTDVFITPYLYASMNMGIKFLVVTWIAKACNCLHLKFQHFQIIWFCK